MFWLNKPEMTALYSIHYACTCVLYNIVVIECVGFLEYEVNLIITYLLMGFSLLIIVLFVIQAKNGECKPLGVCETCSPSKSVSPCIMVMIRVTVTCRVN